MMGLPASVTRGTCRALLALFSAHTSVIEKCIVDNTQYNAKVLSQTQELHALVH